MDLYSKNLKLIFEVAIWIYIQKIKEVVEKKELDISWVILDD